MWHKWGGKRNKGEAEKQEMRAKERLLARKSRVLHFVWHFPNISEGPVCVINENKGSVPPGAISATCHSLCMRNDGKGGPAWTMSPQPTSDPHRTTQRACLLDIRQY